MVIYDTDWTASPTTQTSTAYDTDSIDWYGDEHSVNQIYSCVHVDPVNVEVDICKSWQSLNKGHFSKKQRRSGDAY